MDAAILHSITISADCDATGMFTSMLPPEEAIEGTEEEEDDEVGERVDRLGIAGLGDSPHSRKLQMLILRETCIREVVFMLVKVFKSTGRHFECVGLADLVADPRFGIFKVSQRPLILIPANIKFNALDQINTSHSTDYNELNFLFHHLQ